MKLACISMVKNAERSITEWLAFHFAIGFDSIFLLDNGSTDATVAVADRFSRQHDLHIFDWPLTTMDYQARGFARVLLECRGSYDWCACIDVDEFIVLPPGRTLRDLVDVPETVSAIAMNWAMFGSNGHVARPDGLVIENYTRRADVSFGDNRLIKSFGRPTHVMDCRSPHFFDVNGTYVDMLHRPIDTVDYIVNRTPDYAGGKLHHYFLQSKEDWDAKLARGYHNMQRTPREFDHYDRNEVLDESALDYLPHTLKILNNLDA